MKVTKISWQMNALVLDRHVTHQPEVIEVIKMKLFFDDYMHQEESFPNSNTGLSKTGERQELPWKNRFLVDVYVSHVSPMVIRERVHLPAFLSQCLIPYQIFNDTISYWAYLSLSKTTTRFL